MVSWAPLYIYIESQPIKGSSQPFSNLELDESDLKHSALPIDQCNGPHPDYLTHKKKLLSTKKNSTKLKFIQGKFIQGKCY